jgi:hypothetical protein
VLTDEDGTIPRTGAEQSTDAAGGSGYANGPHVFLPLTWHSGCLLDVVESLVTGFRLVLRILDAEDVDGPLVRGVSMPVDKSAGSSPPVIGEMSIRNGAIDGPSRSWGDLLCLRR